MLVRLKVEPIFSIRHNTEEIYRENKKELCVVFIDLEKIYDQVSRKVLK